MQRNRGNQVHGVNRIVLQNLVQAVVLPGNPQFVPEYLFQRLIGIEHHQFPHIRVLVIDIGKTSAKAQTDQRDFQFFHPVGPSFPAGS